MIKPTIPANEKERLLALRALQILDSSPEERYDRLTRLAQRLFNVPIAVISLIDENRQWFKSAQGLEAKETSRDISFCGHAINGDHIMVVDDALSDVRFSDNPLVTGDLNIRFYAGCPIETSSRLKMGTLCLIDRQPRQLSGIELQLLQNLAQLVETEMLTDTISFSDEISREAEDRFFLSILRYVMEFSRGMRYPIGMLVVHAPRATTVDGKPIINDRMVVEVAKLLGSSIRSSDVVGALGDDSFYVFLPKCDEAGMSLVTQRIHENFPELKSKLLCTPDYDLKHKEFIWTPTDPRSVDDLVKKGLGLLDQLRTEVRSAE